MPCTRRAPGPAMRLLLVGGSRPEIWRRRRLGGCQRGRRAPPARARRRPGAAARRHGADLLLLDAGTDISAAMARLMAERIFLPVVAYGVDCPPQTAAAAIRAGPASSFPCRPRPS